MTTTLEISELALVVLIGASGSGKSAWAARNFKSTEVLSTDRLRLWVSDDPRDPTATDDAFDVLLVLASKRLERGKLTVVDGANVAPAARNELIRVARAQHVRPVAVVFRVSEATCLERNEARGEYRVDPALISREMQTLPDSVQALLDEGFGQAALLEQNAIPRTIVTRVRRTTDRRGDHGPFDIVGDVHGCFDEMCGLLTKLGYVGDVSGAYAHPEGRRAVFVGDLVGNGPEIVQTVETVHAMMEAGSALCVLGDRDAAFLRYLHEDKEIAQEGIANAIEQVEALAAPERAEFAKSMAAFVEKLPTHLVLDDGLLVVAHAGLAERLQNRESALVRDFCLSGDASGDWVADYRGVAAVVYGHGGLKHEDAGGRTEAFTPRVPWVNNTIDLDTGCESGGRLTALRWPEREQVSTPSFAVSPIPAPLPADEEDLPSPPLIPAEPEPPAAVEPPGESLPAVEESEPVTISSPPQTPPAESLAASSAAKLTGATELLISDILGKRVVGTRLAGNVFLRPQYAASALEMLSRFAVDPRWLVYVPPTMAPAGTETSGEALEHPRSAFAYYANQGVLRVVCEEKHMGCRIVVVVCRDARTARDRFQIADGSVGECYTRTGRPCFSRADNDRFFDRLLAALTAIDFWDSHKTSWAVIDAELMPWNYKAAEVVHGHHAPVGAAATQTLAAVAEATRQAKARGVPIEPHDLAARQAAVRGYVDAYRAYCWPLDGLDGMHVAPFHLMATEQSVQIARDHVWHLGALSPLADVDPDLFRGTRQMTVDLLDGASMDAAIDWWRNIVSQQAEGIVVKPLTFLAEGTAGWAQVALKCRGPESLRLIYGPEYTLPSNLERLRGRNVEAKQKLAAREFAVGIEGLERLVRGEPLHRIHECAFAVLALECEPIDPRL